MKRSVILLIAAIFCLSLLVSTSHRSEVAKAQGDQPLLRHSFNCNNGAVSGRYSYHLTGTLAGVGPTHVIGTFTQTPDGTFTGRHEAASFNGQIPPVAIPYNGTFSVNSNCVATGSFTDVTGLRVTFKYVIMDRGEELRFLNTDAGNVLSGVAKRID